MDLSNFTKEQEQCLLDLSKEYNVSHNFNVTNLITFDVCCFNSINRKYVFNNELL